MPFKADPCPAHAAVQMPPAIADGAPRRTLGEGRSFVDLCFGMLFGWFGHGNSVPYFMRPAMFNHSPDECPFIDESLPIRPTCSIRHAGIGCGPRLRP
ncbi:MAG: hypothetical protein WDM76_14630 [Limisphaerales bacterium]